MEANDVIDPTRRQFVSGVAGATVAAAVAGLGAAATADAAEDKTRLGGVHAIPELAPQWKEIDLAKVLKYPAAFLSISQNNSLYKPWGAQASERHWGRGSLPATVKAAVAARKADNFKTFAWIGYEVFREQYPQSEFDRRRVPLSDGSGTPHSTIGTGSRSASSGMSAPSENVPYWMSARSTCSLVKCEARASASCSVTVKPSR
jgi:hypothetical protein